MRLKSPFSSVHTSTICFCSQSYSLKTLSVFERISVDGSPKRIEMYALVKRTSVDEA